MIEAKMASRAIGESWESRSFQAQQAKPSPYRHRRHESAPQRAQQGPAVDPLAVIASDVYGREIPHAFISDEEWLNLKIGAGVPAFYAQLLLGTFKAARNGDFAATDPALATLLGRPPLTMREVLEQQPHNQGEDA